MLVIVGFKVLLKNSFSESAGVSRSFTKKAFWKRSGETVVTNFDFAVIVDQDIAGLQVSVHHVC